MGVEQIVRQIVTKLLGGRLQPVLIACFSLIAAFTVGLSTLVTSRLITEYLDSAMNRRVARDMDLAKTFYQLEMEEISSIGHRMVGEPRVSHNLPAALRGKAAAIDIIDQEIIRKILVPSRDSAHLIAVFDNQGETLAARALTAEGNLSPMVTQGNWAELPIIAEMLSSGEAQSATEIIPAELLARMGLEERAYIALIDTPKAAPKPFDAREGTAGLSMAGACPLKDEDGRVIGGVLVTHLFNNNFTLVDRIKEAAGVDTVTIFFGDLRVSTNVLTEAGERAVGTRISQEVFEVVLEQGLDYVGRAFVVNDWFITRYEPLHDHQGQVVGSLYVGARESVFHALVHTFNRRVALIALVCIVLAGIIAVPIARLITRPIAELVEANRHLAQGEMTVHVQPYGSGELAMLGHSFNKLAETLHQNRQELLHKERLASMGQLAAGVAHEINNPLGTILLLTDVLRNEADAADPKREDLDTIIAETLRCKKIVADLLNFARQQEVLIQETAANALLTQVLVAVSQQPIFEKVEIVRQFSPELPLIQADPAQLQQVFINLLNNAAEAMENGGTITLTTRSVDGQWIEVKVADTGCGIPAQNLGKLYTPFFTTKSLGSGIGLGLSIVYGIIKIHQGQITVQSQDGEGTTFVVTLPVRMADTRRAHPDMQAEAAQ